MAGGGGGRPPFRWLSVSYAAVFSPPYIFRFGNLPHLAKLKLVHGRYRSLLIHPTITHKEIANSFGMVRFENSLSRRFTSEKRSNANRAECPNRFKSHPFRHIHPRSSVAPGAPC